MRMSSHSTAPRRIPRQERGERRVAELLKAAEAEIAEAGYEAATMSGIAERAGASIGSLYQFFPNKHAITRALRNDYARQFDEMYRPLTLRASELNLRELVAHLVNLTVRFVDTHPAFLALLDAPQSTRTSPAIRKLLRARFALFFQAQNRRMAKTRALELATVTLQVIKALNQLYIELPVRNRRKFVQEFKMLLFVYLSERIPANGSGRARL